MEFEEMINELVKWQEADWLLQETVSTDPEKEAFSDPWETWISSGFGSLSPSSGIAFPHHGDALETNEASEIRPLSLGCENPQASEEWLGDGHHLYDGSLGNSSPGSSNDPNEGCKVVASSDGGSTSACSNNSGTGSRLELEQASGDSVLCANSYLESQSMSLDSGCNSSDEQVKVDTGEALGKQPRDTTAVGEDASFTTEEETKRRIRLMRNRESATQSRLRKKSYVKELEMKYRMLESHCSMLQHTVAFTSRENVLLRDELNKLKCPNMNGSKSGVVEPAALPSDSLPSESPRRLTASGPFRWAGWELLVCLYHVLLLTLLGTNVQNRAKGRRRERRPSFQAKRCQVPWGSVLLTTLVSLGRPRGQMMSLGGRVFSCPSRAGKRYSLHITDKTNFVSIVVHQHQHSFKGRKHLKKRCRQRRRYRRHRY